MDADTCNYVLDVSMDFFSLTTETLRLHSNETCQHQTFSALVSSLVASNFREDEQNPVTLRKHLSAIPTTGEIRIHLDIKKTSADNLDEVRDRLREKLGSDVTVGDALSVLLFDYVAEKRAAKLLNSIGLDEKSRNGVDPGPNGPSDGNVLPFR